MTSPTDVPAALADVIAQEEERDPACDFCGADSPTLAFPPVEDAATVRYIDRKVQVEPGTGDWLSCAACAPYVRRLDAAGLAHHAARRLAAHERTDVMGDDERRQAKRMLQRRYEGVLRLLGPAKPYVPPAA